MWACENWSNGLIYILGKNMKMNEDFSKPMKCFCPSIKPHFQEIYVCEIWAITLVLKKC